MKGKAEKDKQFVKRTGITIFSFVIVIGVEFDQSVEFFIVTIDIIVNFLTNMIF